jgi:hypothetical protein
MWFGGRQYHGLSTSSNPLRAGDFVFPFQGSFIQAGIDPTSGIDEFIETIRGWVLKDQGVLDSPSQTLAKSTSKGFVVPADKALAKAELDDILSSRAGLL